LHQVRRGRSQRSGLRRGDRVRRAHRARHGPAARRAPRGDERGGAARGAAEAAAKAREGRVNAPIEKKPLVKVRLSKVVVPGARRPRLWRALGAAAMTLIVLAAALAYPWIARGERWF